MKQSPLVQGSVVVVGVLLLVVLPLRCAFRPARPVLSTDRHEQAGSMLAEHLNLNVPGNGRVVLIVPSASFRMPLVDAQLKSFKKKLDDGIRVVGTEKIQLDRVGPLDGLLTPERYFEYVEGNPDADAFVSFVSLGNFRAQDLSRHESGAPPVIVLSANLLIPQHYLASGLVLFGVEPRIRSSVAKTDVEPDADSSVYRIVDLQAVQK